MKRTVLLILVAVGFSLTSCKKNESTVQGHVWYIDSAGFYHDAVGASITLFSPDTNGTASMTTMTDDLGNYQFMNVADGEHRVYGELMIDSNNVYTGVSEELMTKGAEIVPAEFTLD